MSSQSQLIDKAYIYSGVLAGAESVSKHREVLNRANGFPVPDRDTGNNLSYLMHGILRDLEVADTIKHLLDDVSDLAIIGARGNSGAIFSQFFCGFSALAPPTDQMTVNDLLACFQGGYDYAYRAVKNPVEGTIITAIRGWVEALQQAVSSQLNLATIYQNAYPLFSATVEQTKTMLSAQRHLKSADAGALAFLYFIEGFMKMLVDKVCDYRPQIEVIDNLPSKIYHDNTAQDAVITERYCTEVLLNKNSCYNRAAIEKRLAELGNSIVISESAKLARLHIHSNYPAEVMASAYQMGEILETKAEDMIAQNHLTQLQRGKIALVIDSIADLPRHHLNADTYLLPINILVGAVSYQDKVTAFSDIIVAGKASSAQPNSEQLKKFLAPLCQAYDDIIIITVSAKMSGLYQRYQELIDYFKGEASIHLIDSKLNSVAEGLIVNYAIELIENNHTVAQIKRLLDDAIARTKIYVSVPNLKAMVASGRLNQRIGKFLQYIHYLPLISINKAGEGMVTGLAFSNKKNRQLLINKLRAEKDKIADYAIVHCDNKALADKIAVELTDIVGQPPLYIDQISSVIKLFSGVGSVAIGYTLKG